jgi:hypothetical protein
MFCKAMSTRSGITLWDHILEVAFITTVRGCGPWNSSNGR